MSIRPVGADYLDTPLRRLDHMDHDFYDWRDTWAQPRLEWASGAGLGVWLQLAVEWFPLDISGKPFLPVGAPNRPWPDSETYTQRDYGNRIGVYRMLEALSARSLRASVFLNARVAQRYPLLARHIRETGLDVVAAGLDAGAIHHEGLAEPVERAMIHEVRSILGHRGFDPKVWHSPSWSQSTRTPRLLCEQGFQAMADWANDEAPYLFRTGTGTILSLPTSMELSDREMLMVRKQPLASVVSSLIGAAHRLAREAAESGQARLLTLNFSPWLMGQPYRARAFESILNTISGIEGVHFVDAPQVMEASLDHRLGAVSGLGRT